MHEDLVLVLVAALVVVNDRLGRAMTRYLAARQWDAMMAQFRLAQLRTQSYVLALRIERQQPGYLREYREDLLHE